MTVASRMFEIITACRVCGHKGLKDILHLGDQPLANALVRSGSGSVNKFPLSTAFCPKCSLFQLKETVRKEVLFDHYVWVTGTSKGAREYAELFAQRVAKWAELKAGDRVFEIASNDGTILKRFIERGMEVLGIEPAANIADVANNDGVRTECCYWDVASAERLIAKYGQPRAVMARNVIPHVSDLRGVIDAISRSLSDDGTGVIEFHSGRAIVEELHYDSIYHEHLCYFTLHSLARLLKQYGLSPFSVDTSPISGGSIVVYFSKKERPVQESYVDALRVEKDLRINEQAAWEDFARHSIEHRSQTLRLLNSLKGKTMVGFGASARSATFTQFCGIGKSCFKAIIDNNPLKQGWMTPAGDVPIVSFEEGLALNPDVIFILAWNFAGEIMDQCAKRGFKGQYIVSFPNEPRLISGVQI